MYLIIKRDRTEHLKEKAHKMKKLACEVIECLEEAYEESRYHEGQYGHESTRHDRREDRYEHDDRRYREDEDFGRDMARGRGRGRY